MTIPEQNVRCISAPVLSSNDQLNFLRHLWCIKITVNKINVNKMNVHYNLGSKLQVTLFCLRSGKPTSSLLDNYQPPEMSLDNLASAMYTSGTTGEPKCVLCSHRSHVFAFNRRHLDYHYSDYEIEGELGKEAEREGCNLFFVWEILRPLLKGYYALPFINQTRTVCFKKIGIVQSVTTFLAGIF